MAVQGDQITLTLDELFKDDSVTQWFPKQSKTYKRISSATAEKINAKGGLYLIEKKRPQAINASDFATSDGADFPVGGKLGFLVLTVTPVTHRASVEISSNVEAQNEAALKQRPAKDYDYVMKSIKSLIEAYGLKQSRDLWRDRVGETARISAVNSGTATITCNTAANLFGTFLLQPGMLVEIRDAAGVFHAYAEIDSIDRKNKTAVLTAITDVAGVAGTIAGLGVVANDRVYMKGCYNNNWNGMAYFTAPDGCL
jgi:antitoxin component HigA of HigAB toxin-antitoxin module